MVFGNGCFFILLEDIDFCNFPSLEKITFKNYAFLNINSLKIHNINKLREIIVDDGQSCTRKGKSYIEGTLGEAKYVFLESIFGIWYNN